MVIKSVGRLARFILTKEEGRGLSFVFCKGEGRWGEFELGLVCGASAVFGSRNMRQRLRRWVGAGASEQTFGVVQNSTFFIYFLNYIFTTEKESPKRKEKDSIQDSALRDSLKNSRQSSRFLALVDK